MNAYDTNQLLPCPFCGAGETQIRENGRIWNGVTYTKPTSVSVLHWCERPEGQPFCTLEKIGRDRESAIAAWNRRVAPTPPAQASGQSAALTFDDAVRIARGCTDFGGLGLLKALQEQGFGVFEIDPSALTTQGESRGDQ